jgi:hypothetical protein
MTPQKATLDSFRDSYTLSMSRTLISTFSVCCYSRYLSRWAYLCCNSSGGAAQTPFYQLFNSEVSVRYEHVALQYPRGLKSMRIIIRCSIG